MHFCNEKKKKTDALIRIATHKIEWYNLNKLYILRDLLIKFFIFCHCFHFLFDFT